MDDLTAVPEGAELRAGRPRDQALTARLLESAREELAQSGIAQFSLRSVARRAGASRKSVGSRWPDTHALLVEMLGMKRVPNFRASGDLVSDLVALGLQVTERIGSSEFDLQLRLTADAGLSPELYSEFQQNALKPVYLAIRRVLRRGQRDGVVRKGATGWLPHAFVGALLMKTLSNVGRAPATQLQVQELVDEFVTWVSPP